ncbi:MAG TPA: SAM-dependent methyltransferase [Thermodesulfobacteriota bacterium]|nr:SAM-dependent methyltransferase [Thermodesulfobacteriota bacterium]
MEEDGRSRAEGLKRFILSQIEERGPIPFSQFMEWCLYHPDFGYYQTEGAKIGKEGDYYTNSCVHPLFGYLIAKQLSQMSEILGGEAFDVIEMGAGRGFLCKDILHWAREKAPSFYQRLRYTLIETASHFLEEQKKRLLKEEAAKVFWMSPEAMEKGKNLFEGCFLSNELVDAFPVHRVTQDQGILKELYVTQRNGNFEEQWEGPSDLRIKDYFERMGITLQEGQKAEVNLQALDWIEGAGRCLKRGFVLTIDYGCLAEELYAPYRREGTLLCYSNHRISENPYERIGKQDITSHVNLTGLIRKGEEAGLLLTGLVPQYRFLLGLGFLEEMEAMGKEMSDLDRMKLHLSLKHLIEPEAGMGEVFKVLIQHKGVESPKLDGLRELCSIR